MLHVISLGAGVQSSVMGLMAGKGLIKPMPDCAIFADTLSEPSAVYEWLDWLESQLPFPVYRVSAGNLASSIAVKQGQYRRIDIPAFVQINGRAAGLINRSCTRDYKLRPIQKKMRELAGLVRRHAPKTPIVSNWMGISTDAASKPIENSRGLSRVRDRARPYTEEMMKLNNPLIEKMIERLEAKPETYEQSSYYAPLTTKDARRDNRPLPACGSTQCLAGEAIICAERSVKKGIAKLARLCGPRYPTLYHVRDEAVRLTGLPPALFDASASLWPQPFRDRWFGAATYKGRARAAINLLKAILKTDGKILEQ